MKGFVSDAKQARRYFVSGMVQGVGFRYFAQEEAEHLRLSGYVRNLRDGRVEVYAMGSPEQLDKMRSALERGPSGAMVTGIREEPASPEPQYAGNFIITHER